VYDYGNDLISQDQLLDDGHGGFAWTESFYGYDGHGNVRYLTSATGDVTDTYDYDAFGTLIARTGTTPNSYLYCGEQFDADLGLYYNRTRYLNTDSGRFWTRDVYEGTVYDPSTLHKYLYAGSEPVNHADPSGELTLAEIMSAVGIDKDIRKTLDKFASQVAKRASRKIGCQIAKDASVQGIYVLLLGNGQLYVGQSSDIARRFEEHLRDLEKGGAKIVGMLNITTGIEKARAAKYLREIFERYLIQELKPGANVIKNPIANPKRFLKYVDPVQAGVDKLFKVIPFCK
jgi:RHS repeat-associated protein